MAPENHRFQSSIPHFIGVRKDWRHRSPNPFHSVVGLTPKQLANHAFVIGKTGTGKSVALQHLMAQDIRYGHSFAVLDMRGDLVGTALRLCAGHVQPEKLLLIDLADTGSTMGLNPLAGSGGAHQLALNVLKVVKSESDSWGVQLEQTLLNALLLLGEVGEPITRLDAVFYDRAFRQLCIHDCTLEPVLTFWAQFEALSSEKQLSFAMPVMNKVSLLLSAPSVAKILGHDAPIDLGRHLNRPGNVTLVSLAVHETHAAGQMMGRLLLSYVTREIFSRVTLPESQRVPIRLYVDEFENFGCDEFEEILAEGRKFGITVVLAHQSLSQLSHKTSYKILNGVGAKLVFNCGRADAAAMSSDIAGNAKAIDFTRLSVGDAVLWREGLGCVHVEVNEPLVRDVGGLSPKALQLAEAARATQRSLARPTVRRPLTLVRPALGPRAATKVMAFPQTNPLEDWL